MKKEEKLRLHPIKKTLLWNYISIGALIGFAIIAVFVFSVDQPKAAWGTYWKLKPLILTPMITAFGGGLFYLIEQAFIRNKWSKGWALVIGAIAFIISLWLGIVLGLNGTLWD